MLQWKLMNCSKTYLVPWTKFTTHQEIDAASVFKCTVTHDRWNIIERLFRWWWYQSEGFKCRRVSQLHVLTLNSMHLRDWDLLSDYF